MTAGVRLWTVGHSNRPLEAFLALCATHGIAGIADVRRVPASRRWPHFARAPLERALAAAGIDYLWLPGLGGMREPRPGSPHTAWAEPAFAAYADHLESAEWRAGAEQLLARAAERPTAILCAEARHTDCHRQLIADAMLVRGVQVRHIVDARPAAPHALTPFARLDGQRLVYDRGQVRLGL